jgi:dTDP-4-dehydrorhamnose reductase
VQEKWYDTEFAGRCEASRWSTMSGRILVIGAAGRLGAALTEAFADRPVTAYTRSSLDITDPEAVMRAVTAAPADIIVNCAAFNHVDAAETKPIEALAVNALAVRSLARAAESSAVHYGTDFVFDGDTDHPYTEEAAPAPRSVYATSKLLGDWFALDIRRGFVLRVESLFGAAHGWNARPSTLDGIVGRLERGEAVRVFTDRVVSPSYTPDVAAATRHLLDSGAAPGLYHCVNSGHATWFEVAEECARLLGVPARLEPITLKTHPLPASRPRFCALSNAKLTAAGFPMPTWKDALRRWLASRERRVPTLQ